MIELLPRAACAEWDAYVDRHPEATCYHRSAWTIVAERAYGLRVRRLVSRAGPGWPVRGVLPLIVVPRPLHRYITTGIFGAYGAILVDGAAAEAELIAEARRITDEERACYLHIKALGDGPAPFGMRRKDVWVTAMLSLEGGAERVWKRFRSSIRAAIRQGLRFGFSLRGGTEELPSFYDVLAENMHRKGAPIYGKKLLSEILETFGDQADIVTLWADDRPVSGALILAFNGVMYVPFASSRAAYLRGRPNNLLYWRIIERACAAGLKTLDFGSSLRGTSALAFKLGWGASILPVASYVYARTRQEPRLDPSAKAVQAGIRLWRRLPRSLADAAGPWVCRFMA
jgi:serine/alanine adding enzyme